MLLAALVTGAVLVLPFVVAAPGDFWDETFGFALDEQSLQRLPLPGGWDGGFELNKILAFYMPYVLIGGLALWRRGGRGAPAAATHLGRAAGGARRTRATCSPGRTSSTSCRWPPRSRYCSPPPPRTRGGPRSTLALALPVALIALNGIDQNRIDLLDPGPLRPIHVDVADGVKAPPAEARALEQTVAYIRRAVPPGRPIFVANPRHDLVRVGNPLLYVLADRENPTRYDVMQPGVVTTAPVQREIVRDLRRSRTGLVVRWLSPVAAEREPNGAGRSSGVRVLDRYLAAVYKPVARFGDYQVLRLARPGAE